MPKDDQLLPTSRVAKMLGVDTRTVHRLTTNGHLPSAYKVPGATGTYRFDPVVGDRYLRQKAARDAA